MKNSGDQEGSDLFPDCHSPSGWQNHTSWQVLVTRMWDLLKKGY
jgi:hypothetical protein